MNGNQVWTGGWMRNSTSGNKELTFFVGTPEGEFGESGSWRSTCVVRPRASQVEVVQTGVLAGLDPNKFGFSRSQ